MTNQHDPAELAEAQAQLAALVRDLCEPRRMPILVDGRTEVGVIPSWMDQLRESVSASRNGGRGGGGAPAPINPAAVDVLTELEGSARVLHARVLSRSDRTVEQHLRGIAAEVDGWRSPQQVTAVVRAVGRMLGAVQAQLDPPEHLVSVAHQCPHCDLRMVSRWEPSTGERVQVDALVLDVRDRSVSCRGCESAWPAEFSARLIAEVNEWRAECRRIAAWRFFAVLPYVLAALRRAESERQATRDRGDTAVDQQVLDRA